MELRREHRKLSLAIVVALDRSGSMAARVGGGKTKMDLANLAAVQVLDLLSPMDEFGVIAVDSSPHVIVNLDPVEKNKSLRNRILRIQSMGGGIFVYEALSNAAKMLTAATPQTRHIILFADAADSEEPGKYMELLEKCTQAGITVSVIGLGRPSDVDAWLLEDIAARGQGRCFFTESPSELPRLFAQDTFVVARSSFLEEPTSIKTTAGLISLTGRQFNVSHKIGGYNLCYLRSNANLAVATIDEYQAPVVAAWQVGMGRALCYTGQADGPFTGDIAQWEEIGDFFSSLVRWTIGDTSGLGTDMLLTQQVRSGICLIQLHLDPERGNQTLIDLPKVTTLHGIAGQTPKTRKVTMQFQDADTIAVEVPISGSETALSTVQVPGFAPITLPPVCLPYSPEFIPAQHDQGIVAMAQLARATGGRERINLADIWEDLPRQPQMLSMAPWLLFVAIILLLLEVFQRRTGLLTVRRWRLFRLQAKPKLSKQPVTTDRRKLVRTEETAQKAPLGAQQSDRLVQKPTPATGLLTALSKARKSAKARTDRNK